MSKTDTDDDIYIDCRPLTIKGEEIITNDNNNFSANTNTNTQILDEINGLVLGGQMYDNIGFQTILGITLLEILYGIGSYVFKEFPTNLIEKKTRQY